MPACLLGPADRICSLDTVAVGGETYHFGTGRLHHQEHPLQAAQKNAIKPWQVKTWCIGTPSARFVAKMEDVLEVYARPYDPTHPVVCVDEGAKELRSTPRGTLPCEPEQALRQDYEYARHGKVNLFVAVEPLSGWRSVRVTARHTSVDFAEELRFLVDVMYRDAEQVVLVTDNLNIHTPACLYEAFPPAEARRIARKIEWHYTPEHGSWLNIAEIELSVLHRQCLDHRLEDAETVVREVTAWEQERNRAQRKVNWQFTTADARVKLRRLYPILK